MGNARMTPDPNGKWTWVFRLIVVALLPLGGWTLSTVKSQGESLVRIETQVNALVSQMVLIHANVDDLMIRTYHLEKNKP